MLSNICTWLHSLNNLHRRNPLLELSILLGFIEYHLTDDYFPLRNYHILQLFIIFLNLLKITLVFFVQGFSLGGMIIEIFYPRIIGAENCISNWDIFWNTDYLPFLGIINITWETFLQRFLDIHFQSDFEIARGKKDRHRKRGTQEICWGFQHIYQTCTQTAYQTKL